MGQWEGWGKSTTDPFLRQEKGWRTDPRGAEYDQEVTNTSVNPDGPPDKNFWESLNGGVTYNSDAPPLVNRRQYMWGTRPGQADADVAQYQRMGAAAAERGIDPRYDQNNMQARGFQEGAGRSYASVLAGNAPSVAQGQMAQGLSNSQANAQSIAAGARGGGANMAAAQRAAMQSNAQQAGQANFQSAQLRAQEMDAARQGLLGAGSAMRQGDYQNQGQFLQNRGQNDQTQLGYENLGFNTRKAQLEGSMAGENTQAGLYNSGMDRALNQAQGNAKSQGITGAIGGILGGMLGSDERSKTGIEDDNPYTKRFSTGGVDGSNPYVKLDTTDLNKKSQDDAMRANIGKAVRAQTPQDNGSKLGSGLGAILGKGLSSDEDAKRNVRHSELLDFAQRLDPKSFEYKHPEPGMEGRMHGVLAQDMERSRAGNEAVVETPAGKAIDIKKGLSLALASLAALKDEIDGLKGGKRGRR